MRSGMLLALLAVLVLPAAAADGAVEAHVLRLSAELRCLVCQNQTLADSHAQLAVDLRAEIRAQLAGGATDEQVVDFMVQRYGDFVRYRPALKPSTWLLWFGPLAMLLGGALLLLRKHIRWAGGNAEDSAEVSA